MTTPRPPSSGRRYRKLAIPLVLVAMIAAFSFWRLSRFDPWGTARAAFERRETGTALRLARGYLQSHPGDPRASLLAARCETRLGRIDVAETHFEAADPQGVEDLHARAFGLIKLHRPDQAARVYQALLARSPGDALALQRLGSIRIGQKNWPEVVKTAEALIAVPDAEVAGQTMLAIARHESRQYKTAIPAFERVLEIDPDLEAMPLPKPLFWRNYATDLLAEGRVADARTLLEKAVADRLDVALVELLGQAYLLDNQAEKAEACWRKAIEIDDAFVDTWLDLGQLEIRRRNWTASVESLKRAIALDPGRVESHHALGIALRNLGQTAEADRESAIAASLRSRKNASTVDGGR